MAQKSEEKSHDQYGPSGLGLNTPRTLDELGVGSCVLVAGLEKAAHYNGLIGRITGVSGPGRFAVRLDPQLVEAVKSWSAQKHGVSMEELDIKNVISIKTTNLHKIVDIERELNAMFPVWYTEEEQIKNQQIAQIPNNVPDKSILVLQKRTSKGSHMTSAKYLLRIGSEREHVQSQLEQLYVTLMTCEMESVQAQAILFSIFRSFQSMTVEKPIPGSMLYTMNTSIGGRPFPQMGWNCQNARTYATQPWHFVMEYRLEDINRFGSVERFEKELFMIFGIAQTSNQIVRDQEVRLWKHFKRMGIPNENGGGWIYTLPYDDEGLDNGFWYDNDGRLKMDLFQEYVILKPVQ